MEFAETYALPLEGTLGPSVRRTNEFQEPFTVRPGQIHFLATGGHGLNIKVVLTVYRDDGSSEQFIVDTDPSGGGSEPDGRRQTRDFVVHAFPRQQGRARCVKFSYIVHLGERSIPSRDEYIFMDARELEEDRPQRRQVTREWATPNAYRTVELDAGLLQRDADWYNRHPESLGVVPKFTKGQPSHPYHPKRFIHDQIDAVIRRPREEPDGQRAVKVCVDCLDDTDFVTHLIHAADNGVRVQCLVDWRKMMLTNSDNYVRLKRSAVELLGVFCTPTHPLIEVAPDMHNKFIIFGDEDCLVGSFNVTFDRWGANWESGLAFHSRGVCRLLDNVFQSVRGGVIQRYGIDPLSPVNVLYTFGRHAMLNGRYYRPHHAILSEIHRARSSIRASLFFVGELLGEHGDSVVDAVIRARDRGVDVRLILNGHMARQGSPAQEYSMRDELQRPLLPAITRLRQAGIPVALAYGLVDHRVPFSPLHSKYCVVDGRVVLDGSFNWYNTSTFSHDLLVVVRSEEVARHYLYEFDQILRLFRIYWMNQPS
jgi:hypothetical protein